MQEYKDHFNNLAPPLSPNDTETKIYQDYCLNTKTLLLGYTKELLHLCTEAMDLNPPNKCNKKVINQDWFTITTQYDTIIGDGVLNLVGGTLVQYLSKYCKTLIIRFFTEKIDTMKYATYFKHNTEFLLPDIVLPTQKSCVILVWKFSN